MSSETVEIAIIGPFSLQNQLLVFFVQEKTGLRCFLCVRCSDCFVENGLADNGLELILYDCLGLKKAEILEMLSLGARKDLLRTYYYILFNLDPAAGVESEALGSGARGFIYEQECVDNLLKAIQAVLAGEVWLPRKKFAECLAMKSRPRAENYPDLTAREIKILRCLNKGYTNQMIGEKLCISCHTVKAHLSNIYKKIHVAGRKQAIHWAEKHL